MVQNDKTFCPLHSISQEPYIIWLPFVVHICKIIISSGLVSFFQNINFLVHREVKEQKTVQNNKISPYLRNHASYDCHLWCKCVRWSPGVFYNFKTLIFRIVRGMKRQKTAQNDKYFCLSHLTFQEPYIIWSYLWYTCRYEIKFLIFGTHV